MGTITVLLLLGMIVLVLGVVALILFFGLGKKKDQEKPPTESH